MLTQCFPRRRNGFTYVSLIILVAIIGLLGAATLKIDVLMRRAAAEQELLEIGASFIAALDSYAAVTPPGQLQQPQSLQVLLKDPRFPGIRRHLRVIPIDPITGKAEWGMLRERINGGIVGFYSLSSAKPLKRANFESGFRSLNDKERLSDWKFISSSQLRTLQN